MNDSEDIDGAIEALERRAAYLSDQMDRQPGHWRVGAELKAIRMGIKATREYADKRAGRPQPDEPTLKLLVDVLDLLDDLAEARGGGLDHGYLTRIDAMSLRIEEAIGGEDE